MLPDLESLRCFDAAGRHLNFRRAAAEVALSPTAFSDRILRLEDALKAQLFTRTTRSVALTPEGIALLPQARRALEEARRCLEVVKTRERPRVQLRVGTRYELGVSWLTTSLTALRERLPHLELRLQFGDSPELLEQVRAGLIDAVVTSFRLTAPWCRYATLHEETYCFVGASALLKKRPLFRDSQAVSHRLIDTQPDLPLFRYFLDASPSSEHWAFREMEYLGAISAVRARVMEGAGVAVLPEYFIRQDLARGRLRRICSDRRLRSDAFRLVWREGAPLEDSLRDLAAELRKIPLR